MPSASHAPMRAKNGRWTHTLGKPPGTGHLQRAVRRAFIAADYRPLTIRAFLPRCYPRAETYTQGMRESVRQALRREYVSFGRQAHMQGRPTLWAPK
jgi:hypothetical protein